MANPKTASEKYTQYENDSFNIWMQKTNVLSREQGDLNNLPPKVLTELQSTTARSGTVAGIIYEYVLTGTSTTFTTDVSVGDILKITTSTPTTIEARVIQVTSDTSLTLDRKLPEVFTGATYENLKELSLVSAINSIDDDIRRSLIRSIAMS